MGQRSAKSSAIASRVFKLNLAVTQSVPASTGAAVIHLAGRLGVAVADALVSLGAVTFADSTASLTPNGNALLQRLGVDVIGDGKRRPLCRACIDWSERRRMLPAWSAQRLRQCAPSP